MTDVQALAGALILLAIVTGALWMRVRDVSQRQTAHMGRHLDDTRWVVEQFRKVEEHSHDEDECEDCDDEAMDSTGRTVRDVGGDAETSLDDVQRTDDGGPMVDVQRVSDASTSTAGTRSSLKGW